MFKSYDIEVNGHFAGIAVTTVAGFRFIAVDPRVIDLDGSECRAWRMSGVWFRVKSTAARNRRVRRIGALPRR